jgi:Trypsin-like peptidase domain
MIRSTGSIVAALMVNMFASMALAGGPFGSIDVGNWKGGAYTNDKDGTFAHCSAATEVQNGSSVSITKDVRGRLALSLAYSAWQLVPGKKFPISVTFGDHEHLRFTGTAATNTIMNAPLPNNVCGFPHRSGEATVPTGAAPSSNGIAAFLGNDAAKLKDESKTQSCRRSAFVDHFGKSHLLVVTASTQTFQVALMSPDHLLSAISNCVARMKSGGVAEAEDFSDAGQKTSAVTAPNEAKASATVPVVAEPEQTPPLPAARQRSITADTAAVTPSENPIVSSITEPTSSPEATTTVTTAPLQTKESANLIDVTGAGLVIDHHGYIATANHVVSNCMGEIHANLTGDGDMVLKIVAADIANDLALLRAPRRFNDVGLVRGTSILVGDPVIAIGTSQKPVPNLVADRGFVTSLSGLSNDTRFMQISTLTQIASDGGPVLDIRGGIVGLIAKREKSNLSVAAISGIPETTNFAIKSGAMRDFLDNSAVAYRTANPETESAAAQLVSNAKAYTVLISCKTR